MGTNVDVKIWCSQRVERTPPKSFCGELWVEGGKYAKKMASESFALSVFFSLCSEIIENVNCHETTRDKYGNRKGSRMKIS